MMVWPLVGSISGSWPPFPPLTWAACLRPILLSGIPLFRRRAGRGQAQGVDGDQRADEPRRQTFHHGEALVFPKRGFVHVEVAADLDLERVDAVMRAAIAAGGVPARIGAVARHLETGAREDGFGQ